MKAAAGANFNDEEVSVRRLHYQASANLAQIGKYEELREELERLAEAENHSVAAPEQSELPPPLGEEAPAPDSTKTGVPANAPSDDPKRFSVYYRGRTFPFKTRAEALAMVHRVLPERVEVLDTATDEMVYEEHPEPEPEDLLPPRPQEDDENQ